MTDPKVTAALGSVLVSRAGGYLRNPLRVDQVTCTVCATPTAGYVRCYTCQMHRSSPGLADSTAFATYAVGGQQSGYVMREYKAQRPVKEHVTIVTLLTFPALALHSQCPEALLGKPVTHWAAVPSLPAKPGEVPVDGGACSG